MYDGSSLSKIYQMVIDLYPNVNIKVIWLYTQVYIYTSKTIWSSITVRIHICSLCIVCNSLYICGRIRLYPSSSIQKKNLVCRVLIYLYLLSRLKWLKDRQSYVIFVPLSINVRFSYSFPPSTKCMCLLRNWVHIYTFRPVFNRNLHSATGKIGQSNFSRLLHIFFKNSSID